MQLYCIPRMEWMVPFANMETSTLDMQVILICETEIKGSVLFQSQKKKPIILKRKIFHSIHWQQYRNILSLTWNVFKLKPVTYFWLAEPSSSSKKWITVCLLWCHLGKRLWLAIIINLHRFIFPWYVMYFEMFD